MTSYGSKGRIKEYDLIKNEMYNLVLSKNLSSNESWQVILDHHYKLILKKYSDFELGLLKERIAYSIATYIHSKP